MNAVACLQTPAQSSRRRGVLPELADIFHDGCVIADRDGSPIETALDGAAQSHGFASWADAKRKLSTAA